MREAVSLGKGELSEVSDERFRAVH